MATLQARLTLLAQAIGAKIKPLRGGTSGQVLSKTSGTDFAFSWITPPTGGGQSGSHRGAWSASPLEPYVYSDTVTHWGKDWMCLLDGTTETPPNSSEWILIPTEVRGASFFCGGVPEDNEVIGGTIAPYAFTLNEGRSKAQSETAFTAAKTFIIKNNGSQIGSVSFAAAATLGTVSYSSTSISQNDKITIHAPATADSTGGDISILLRA